MKLKGNFQRGGEILEEIPSVGEVWAFSGTTNLPGPFPVKQETMKRYLPDGTFLSPVFLSVKDIYVCQIKISTYTEIKHQLHEQRSPSNRSEKLMKYKESPLIGHQNKSCVLVSHYLIFSGVSSSSFGSVFCPCLASKTLICTCSSMQTSLSL